MLKLGRNALLPLMKWNYDIETTRYKGEVESPCIVVCNHSSGYDIPCTIDAFPHYSRFIISDSLIRKRLKKIIFSLITDGIYRRKGENADSVVESCESTIKEGINVCMFPEGGVSTNGVTGPIRKRTGQMIKDLNVPLITYRLEGSYFIKPRWANNRAKGPIFGGIVNVYSKEDIQKMSVEEINETIYKDLYINHYDWIREKMIMYRRKDPAEAMEIVLYTCPKCREMGHIHSKGDTLSCSACGYTLKVNEFGLFVGSDVVFDNLYDWDVWQKELLRTKCPSWKEEPDKVITSDEHLKYYSANGDVRTLVDDDVTLSITYNEVIIKGKNVDIRERLDQLNGMNNTRHGILQISAKSGFHTVTSDTPVCFGRYRTIRRIIQGEDNI